MFSRNTSTRRRGFSFCLTAAVVILHHDELACIAAASPADTRDDTRRSRRIAIIGGGIAGSFCAKYLADYDQRCMLDAIDIYEPSPMSIVGQAKSGVAVTDTDDGIETKQTWQGSRVSSVTLSDGTIVELGASIIYDGNKLAVQMMEGDSTLSAARPFFPGKGKSESEKGKEIKSGFGIYDGNGTWLLNTATILNMARKLALLWRYNIDLFRISKAASSAITSFNLIYELLDSTRPVTFLDSPDGIWESVGLKKLSLVSYDEFLNAIGVCHDVQWWRSFLPYQGCIRTELLSAATINNYNQEVSRMNGLSGLVSFIPTKGTLFSVKGGNYQLIESALTQAQRERTVQCKGGNEHQVNHVAIEVTTVIGDLETGIELFSGERSLGNYDVVILAAPLQQSGIDFLVKSHLDGAVLQAMPLSGLIDTDQGDANMHQHITPSLPSSATRSYTQVVTSVVTNGNLQSSYFNISDSRVPRSIYFSERGRQMENAFTITHLTSDGVFKVFSQSELSKETLINIFGPTHKLEYVKVWGGKHGGATPDFNGGGESSTSTPFLIYDGGASTLGHGFGPALFYVNAMEASVAAVEISAIGAKAVAKLCAKRLELIAPPEDSRGDEL